MNLKFILTVTNAPLIASLVGKAFTLGTLPLSGVVGSMLGSALVGSEVDSTLTVSAASGELKESLTFNTTDELLKDILKAFALEQPIPAIVSEIISRLAPEGAVFGLKLTVVSA